MANTLTPERMIKIRDAVNAELPDTHFAVILAVPFMGIGEYGQLQTIATAETHPLQAIRITSTLLHAQINAVCL
jgi:hypothetical protein